MCSILGYLSLKDFDKVKQGFDETTSRGPDMERYLEFSNAILGFKRLSIMGIEENGMQPFSYKNYHLVCNGEIYGFRKRKEELEEKGYSFKSGSDCEILLPLYELYGPEMFKTLDAEFALIIYDELSEDFIAARDPIGIRPLYYGYDNDHKIIFASEPKCLTGIAKKILPFPPGHYYKDGKFICYNDITKFDKLVNDNLENVCKNIRNLLIEGVNKRLDSDVPVGFLLSGGLDSSLVCAIASKKLKYPIETYSIGMNTDAIDLKYAKQVSEFIHSNHHEIIITKDDVINALDEVIKILGTFDITTIRASIGMYLLCKKTHQESNIKVLLTGEISDELFGYKYTDFAPNALEFQNESIKRIKELHMYDVLRADRCISANSLEARVPFGDLAFVNYVMSINPEMKLNHYNMGKYLLRHAFDYDNILPYDILMREKAAFSDAVGHSMVDYLKEYANSYYTDEDYNTLILKYDHARPFTKESLLYREIFEKYYKGQSEMVIDFWMPNKNWENCNVKDPSARVLKNYGNSGK